jgi:hypothetical protein
MKDNTLLLIVAVVAVSVSLFAAVFTYLSIANLATTITGFQSSTGEANLTVETSATINFTNGSINWGNGKVNFGVAAASLDTEGLTGAVVGGNWTAQTGLNIENIGNVNVSIKIAAGKTNDTFIGGNLPVYRLNVTEIESGSCLNSTGGTAHLTNINRSIVVNTTTTGTIFCYILPFTDSYDKIRVDINLTVPSDASTGAKTDTLTATATAV